ncbi:hypothetical protein H6F61_25815 [Cyanobacteria bacterium FACHB-472]|nr:hypothetical protein [Cyanobacteria bacterium FACHB-472]
MSKTVYDVIQRFEVENGVPRLVSTNIQVIQGGEDLMSLAIRLLSQLGFYDKFEENRASQYIGFRLKNPAKGAKRYQLVLAQRKEGLCISIPKEVLQKDILELICTTIDMDYTDMCYSGANNFLGRVWILPSKEDVFLESFQFYYPNVFKGKVAGSVSLKKDYPEEFKIEHLGGIDSYLALTEDKLFPYAWQVCITSKEVLEEFLGYFAKILMEK